MRFKVKRHAKFSRPAKSPKPEGLGDLVAAVAEPVKRACIRRGPEWLKRMLERCKCDKRRQWLNRLLG